MPSFPELPGEEIMEIIVMLEKSLANKRLARFPVQTLAKKKKIAAPHTGRRWALGVPTAYLSLPTFGYMPTFRADPVILGMKQNEVIWT